MFAQIRHENPIWDPGPDYASHATVRPLQQQLVGSARTMLWLLFGVVGVVLLIACANVANLLLVRATMRQKEVAVRMALGGGRGRIIRQLLTESVTLALLGGAAGIALAWWGVHALVAILPADVPRVANIGIDLRALAFTTLLVVTTGIAFGLLPAIRSSGATAQTALRDGSRTAGSSNRRLASLLVCGEVGAAVLLLIAAMLLVRSMWALHEVDPGFRTTSIVTARISPPQRRYADAKTIVPFVDEVLRRVRAIPGVEAVAAVDNLPLDARSARHRDSHRRPVRGPSSQSADDRSLSNCDAGLLLDDGNSADRGPAIGRRRSRRRSGRRARQRIVRSPLLAGGRRDRKTHRLSVAE